MAYGLGPSTSQCTAILEEYASNDLYVATFKSWPQLVSSKLDGQAFSSLSIDVQY